MNHSELQEKYQAALALERKAALLTPDAGLDEAISNRNAAFRAVCEQLSHDEAGCDDESLLLWTSALLFLSEGIKDQPGAFYLPRPRQWLCGSLVSMKNAALSFHHEQVLGLQQQILHSVAELPPYTRHALKRSALDKVIKRLLILEQEKDLARSLNRLLALTLAKAYLYRSRIIQVKGFSVPQKKYEALESALKYVKVACNDNDIEALRLKALAYIEQERIGGRPPDFGEFLEQTVNLDSFRKRFQPEDIQIILRQAEYNKNTLRVQEILADPYSNALDKARAALIAGRLEPVDLARWGREAVQFTSDYSFVDPSWERLTLFLQQAYTPLSPGLPCSWKALVHAAWQSCRQKENLLYHNCHLRWYWSKCAALYDLAFFAAEKSGEKARVADSLKARTTLRQQVLEEMAGKDEQFRQRYAKNIEEQTISIGDGYAKKLTFPRSAPTAVEDEMALPPPTMESLPEPWIAVHFYISNGAFDGGKRGWVYSSIYDSQKGWQKEPEPFDGNRLWEAFWSWQENYAIPVSGKEADKLLIERAGRKLEGLIDLIGQCMPFLFKWEKERPVVFIPHGFLHRLPLHMAKNPESNGQDIWAKKHPFTVLPAWSLWQPSVVMNGASAHDTGVLKWYPEYDYPEIFKPPEMPWSIADHNAKADAILRLCTSPEFLLLLCHGVAHPTNPFEAGLMWQDKKLTCSEILSDPQFNLRGTRVFLGACETDLVPPQGAPLDEHLSISSIFLQKGANEVLGGLWKVHPTDIEDLVKRIRPDGDRSQPLYESLWKWHKAELRRPVQAKRLFTIGAFRTLGLPVHAPPETGNSPEPPISSQNRSV